jgi:hypothetical protein
VPHPIGVERIATVREAIEAIARLRAVKPELTGVIVKLDEATGGEGNAAVFLEGLPRPGAGDERERIAERLQRMVLEARGVSAAAYLSKLAARVSRPTLPTRRRSPSSPGRSAERSPARA